MDEHTSPTGRAHDELLDVVDAQDRVVDQRPRGEVYARRLRHRSVAIRVRDAADRLFVHRRTPGKLIFPSRYDLVVGGVVGAGEEYDAAALREAREELGVGELPAPTPRFRFRFETPEYDWFVWVYEVVCAHPVAPQPEEIAWHAFVTDAQLATLLPQWDLVPDGWESHRRLDAWHAAHDTAE